MSRSSARDGAHGAHRVTRVAAAELLCLLLAGPVLLFPGRFPWFIVLAAVVLVCAPRVAALVGREPSDARTALMLPGPPVAAFGVATLIAAAASADWTRSEVRALCVLYGVAAGYAYARIVALAATERMWTASLLLFTPGAAVALLAVVATEWNERKVPLLGAVYDLLLTLTHRLGVLPRLGAATGIEPNEVAGVLSLLTPVGVGAVVRWRRQRSALALSAAATAVMALVLALTGSRSAYLGLLTSGAMLFVLHRPRIAVPSGAAIAAVVVLVLWHGRTRFLALALGEESSMGMSITPGALAGRLEVWQHSVYMLQDYPVTGVGLNMFPIVSDAAYPLFLHGPATRLPHAHNFFLQVALDFGLPGLLAFLWLLRASFAAWCRSWRAARQARSEDRWVLCGILAGVVAFLTYGLTDAVALGAKPSFVLWMVLGVTVGLGSHIEKRCASRRRDTEPTQAPVRPSVLGRLPVSGAIAGSAYLIAALAWFAQDAHSPWERLPYRMQATVAPPAGAVPAAGTGVPGYTGDGMTGSASRLWAPQSIAAGPTGDLYIADAQNHRIRRLQPDGSISTVAGRGCCPRVYDMGEDQPVAQSVLFLPTGVDVGWDGTIYIADSNHHRVRALLPDGQLRTVAGTGPAPGLGGFSGDGGSARGARLSFPTGVAVRADGGVLVADANNHRVRLVTPDGIISTIAGTGVRGHSGDGGPATRATLSFPTAVTITPGGEILVGDAGGQIVRHIGSGGIIRTLPRQEWRRWYPDLDGTPLLEQASLTGPWPLARAGGVWYMTDAARHRVVRLQSELAQ